MTQLQKRRLALARLQDRHILSQRHAEWAAKCIINRAKEKLYELSYFGVVDSRLDLVVEAFKLSVDKMLVSKKYQVSPDHFEYAKALAIAGLDRLV